MFVRLHVMLRLVECGRHPVRDAGRTAAILRQNSPRNTAEGNQSNH